MKIRYALPVVLLIGWFISWPAHGQTVDVTVIDVGQGDSILIAFPPDANGNRRHMLIDGGGSTANDNIVIQVLREENINELDVVVLTHPHIDHYGGLIEVLKQLTVKEFWWNGEARGPSRNENTPTIWTNLEDARSRAETLVMVEQGMKRYFQGARIEVLNAGGEYPNTNKGKDINNDSIVLMLYYRGVKVLFPGDIEEAEGLDLVNDYCSRSRGRCRKLDVDIIKIPHHGSAHFSSNFVKFADAEAVLISAGFKNKQFHHPRQAALRAYEEFGAEHFYSTSLEGTNHTNVTIGPKSDQYTIDGAETGFTYWRDLDDDEICETDPNASRFCLEFAK